MGPLFLLSFRHCDELARTTESAGWQPVAARRGEGAEARFLASGAAVAVVDARGAASEGVAALRALGQAVEANFGALLVLVSRSDEALLDIAYDHGATHFLVSPFGEGQLLHAIRSAARHAERVGRVEVGGPQLPAEGGHDALTGVDDARAARSWIAARLAGPPPGQDEPAAVVLLLALTRFDAINLAFGRASGDAVLQAAARRIARQADADGDGRRVARLAGAEFAVLLSAPSAIAEARFLAAQLIEAMARPFISGDTIITLGSRVGIAVSRPGDSAATLLRRASAALASAREQEVDPISLIDADVEQASAQGDRLEIDLRRALNAGEIDVLFQPQVRIADDRIVGVEALARWNHPVYGSLGAPTLFGVAERSDYLVQLSEHVQRAALRAAARWPSSLADLRVAVNVTAQDIARPGFAAHFLEMVADSGFDTGRVTVEVTENALIDDLPHAAAVLADLRAAGLRIAIDDFGTGYSSLAYLKALPLDYLKLDKRLCEDIVGSPRDRIVVSSVIDMAHSLGLAIIAEGVEKAEQRDLLAVAGCDIYQGFLCAQPLGTPALDLLVGGEIAEAIP